MNDGDLPKIKTEEVKSKRTDDKSIDVKPMKKMRKKHPFSNRVGSVADMMKQYYRAK